jgi:anaerobic ribonucleoside-triphosphate reductase activating protein
MHCYNCQNPQTWDFNAGAVFDSAAKERLFEALNHPYIQGLTLSGGHPLEPQNLKGVYEIVKETKEMLPDKDIWLYTGYTLDANDFYTPSNFDTAFLRNYIISMCDVVVDGNYVDSLRDLTLPFRGSSNQRLIDVNETIKQGQIVLYNTKL